ncbi:MAG TPA: hypothetical protein VKD72_14695, partial [Gemmataceae bacterium]|nr:hypothetical protein [Gemmataceae bacterium]
MKGQNKKCRAAGRRHVACSFPNARKIGDDPEPDRDHTDPTGPCLPARGRGGVVVHRALLGAGPGFPRHGVWPLVNIDTFQLVTGPKTDLWLV